MRESRQSMIELGTEENESGQVEEKTGGWMVRKGE
jgi:hypothetical protein